MVQVYSLSSSSRTVQLYSRSRLLLLPLINLLSIFPPARPRERRGGAADPGPGAPQPGSSARAPGTCTIPLAGSPPLPPAGPAPPPCPPAPPPPSPSPELATRSLSSAPCSLCPARGRGLGRRGSNGGSARRNRVAEGRANRNSALEMIDRLRKQSQESSRTEPPGTSLLASQTRGSSVLCGSYRCCCPSPRPGVGIRLDRTLLPGIRLNSASGARSHTLQHRGSRPLESRGGAR